jgi:hypothetical protein
MVTFGDHLYAGTSNESGGELWRSDGGAWEQVAAGGFDDAANTDMDHLAVFSNMLYVATNYSTGTPQIWRSPSGDFDSWEKVKDGLGGVMHVFDGYLYLGGSQDGKAALWRTENGTDWTPIFTDGLG